MKEYNKFSKLEYVVYDICGFVLEEVMWMWVNGEKILCLNIGNLVEFGFIVLDEVIYDLIMNVCDSEGYFDFKGIFLVCKVIM